MVAQSRDNCSAASAGPGIVLALCAYMQHDYPAASSLIRQADVQDNPIYHIVAAAIFGETQATRDSAREIEWIQSNAPGLLANIRAEVARRLGKVEDQDHLLEGLAKVGLQIE